MITLIKKLIPNRIKKRLKLIVLEGDVVYCPVCEKGFECFLPFEKQLRPHARCPNCDSLERTRLIWMFLTHSMKIQSESISLLHVAPEKGLMARFSKESNINYHPIDKRGEEYKFTDCVLTMDLCNLNYPDERFDCIICSHVLEHVEDDKIALKEIYRVLKNKGWGILQVPIDENRDTTFEDPSVLTPADRKRTFGQSDHVRIYGNDYQTRLEDAGFRVEVKDFAQYFSKGERFRYGLLNRERLWVIHKT